MLFIKPRFDRGVCGKAVQAPSAPAFLGQFQISSVGTHPVELVIPPGAANAPRAGDLIVGVRADVNYKTSPLKRMWGPPYPQYTPILGIDENAATSTSLGIFVQEVELVPPVSYFFGNFQTGNDKYCSSNGILVFSPGAGLDSPVLASQGRSQTPITFKPITPNTPGSTIIAVVAAGRNGGRDLNTINIGNGMTIVYQHATVGTDPTLQNQGIKVTASLTQWDGLGPFQIPPIAPGSVNDPDPGHINDSWITAVFAIQ